ncbi:DUF362 domain-containing protein [Geosporobacter ferrireducens]|uniref:FeS-binding protein n=1 Tax=Geosporobacter ferrireducens TaxID=1424294 RepID=A0A1D8GPR0_9FIRM|nr:DUF362 domain-containing protein [Geosporobacter ferrireducens]AOT72912.1 FeS-binding protein [Geosporobacter ferrireducens]
MSKTKVAVVKCLPLAGNASFMGGKFIREEDDVSKIKATVAKAVELAIGSLDVIIKPGQTVLIKPNLAFQAPAESHAVVDPRVVEAVVSYVKENSQASEVWIGDNPSLGMHVGRAKPAFAESGMEDAARRGGVDKVIYFDETEVVEVEIPEAKVFKKAAVFKPVMDADVVINLPKLKVHLAGTVTLGLKNWNGIIPNMHPSAQQQGAHRIDLGPKFADLYRVRKADLTIVDAIIGMEGQGPHAGTPVEMNLIIAGTDTVATDAVSAYIMGFDPIEIPAIRCTANEGLGEMDLEKIEVVGEPADAVRRHFGRPNDNPIGMYKGFTVYAQQTCPGCYANVRGALDSFKNTGINMTEFISKKGEVVVAAGGLPDFDPEFAKDKNLFVVGDCWEYFPTSDNIRQAINVAKSVTYYPGCAPVYIFAQLNADLQKMAKAE